MWVFGVLCCVDGITPSLELFVVNAGHAVYDALLLLFYALKFPVHFPVRFQENEGADGLTVTNVSIPTITDWPSGEKRGNLRPQPQKARHPSSKHPTQPLLGRHFPHNMQNTVVPVR